MKKNITIIKVDTNPGFFHTSGDFSEEISRARFPNFQWNDKGLKKITKFRYFLAGINLWFLQLKDKLKTKYESR